MRPTVEERFWAKVDTSAGPDGCWNWLGAGGAGLHGVIWRGGSNVGAHRLSWELRNGVKVPDGLFVCHSCDNPSCVNPDHLWVGTQAQNMRDCQMKGRRARGDRHGSRLHPDRVARGDRNGARLHPERMPRGERNGSAKLSVNDVLSILQMHSAGGVTQKEIAKLHGVSPSLVHCIVSRKNWTHVIPDGVPA